MNEIAQPVNTDWFQKRLNHLCRDRNLALRIVWAPSLRARKVVLENNQRVLKEYAKYPIVKGEVTEYVLGHYFQRSINGKMTSIGYQKVGGLAIGNILPTDLVVPHYETINHSIHIFVIEQKIQDAEARRIHAKKRELSKEHLGFDIYGAFPAEGMWEWRGDVSEHREGCCDIAKEVGTVCSGLYREPDERDLDDVRELIGVRDNIPNLVDRTPLIQQAVTDQFYAYAEYKRKQREEWKVMGAEIDELAIKALEGGQSTVFLDPGKRFRRTETSRAIAQAKEE